MNTKSLFGFVILLTTCFSSFTQNNVGIGTITPDPTAVLDIEATDKGMLIPRLTTTQRTSIVNPANGLLVFDLDVECFFFYNGNSSTWENICATSGGTGINCWDTNGDGVNDAGEDVNGDGSWDALDCQGATGPAGPAGANGTDGTNGTNGLACWDLNGDGIQDAGEDINGDGAWNALDCKGDQGLACWDTNGDGVQDAGEDTNGDGIWDASDCGGTGQDGLSCWDANGDGVADAGEDINGDGSWDYLDCVGATGPAGANGADGTNGTNGANGADGADGADGIACWDTNGDGVQDAGEDTNGDGSWDALDCQGPTWSITSTVINGDGTFTINTDEPATINSTNSAWTTIGNSGTVNGVNFLGTTDAVDLELHTNALERLRILSSGEVGIGTTAPTRTLDVNGAARIRTLTDVSSSTTAYSMVVADANGNLEKWDTQVPYGTNTQNYQETGDISVVGAAAPVWSNFTSITFTPVHSTVYVCVSMAGVFTPGSATGGNYGEIRVTSGGTSYGGSNFIVGETDGGAFNRVWESQLMYIAVPATPGTPITIDIDWRFITTVIGTLDCLASSDPNGNHGTVFILD